LVLVFAVAVAPARARAEGDANWQRLRAMPREQRLLLAEKLQRFDALSPREQAAVRSLEEQIARLEPADQIRYLAVLRRYHLWFRSLPEARRNEISAAPPDQRMNVVAKLRADQREAAKQPASAVLPVAGLGRNSLVETALMLEVWSALTPEQRAEIDQLPQDNDRRDRLLELGRALRIKPPVRLTQVQVAELIARVESAPQSKAWLRPILKKMESNKQARALHRLADNLYFLEHPPEKVEASRLLRFESTLPAWISAWYDPLPPEEARRRLTILYRLMYPYPSELPDAAPSQSAPAAGSTPSAPSPPARPTSPAPGTLPF
jgi:hypothetical protein